MAEISGGLNTFGLAFNFNFDAGVAIRAGNDLVGNALALFLDFRVFAAHEPLDGVNRVARVRDGLALGGIAHQSLAVLGESDHRRRHATPLGILQHDGLAAFHDRHAGIRRSQINANYFSHNKLSLDSMNPDYF